MNDKLFLHSYLKIMTSTEMIGDDIVIDEAIDDDDDNIDNNTNNNTIEDHLLMESAIPETLFIHLSSYLDEEHNVLAERATQEDFINFIRHKSFHKFYEESALITSNMNRISFLYIDPNNNTTTNINTHPTISKQLIKETYPDIYEQLLRGHKVIIAWMLSDHKPHCADGVYVCEFIESRIKHNIVSIFHYMRLMLQSMNLVFNECGDKEWVPDNIRSPIDSIFWYGRMAKFAAGMNDFEHVIKEELSQLFITNVDDIYAHMSGVIDYFTFVERVNKEYDEVDGANFDDSCTIYLVEQYLELFNWDTTDVNMEEFAEYVAKHIHVMRMK